MSRFKGFSFLTIPNAVLAMGFLAIFAILSLPILHDAASVKRTLEIHTQIDDRGTEALSVLGSGTDKEWYLGSLGVWGNSSADLAQKDELLAILRNIHGENFNITIIVGSTAKSIGQLPPFHAEMTELPLPLAGGAGLNKRGVVRVYVW